MSLASDQSREALYQPFPVVGIGFSAGGVDAFKRLLKCLPRKSGMAYVLVQRLASAYSSILPEIISQSTNLPVHHITDDVRLEPDHIYIIPDSKVVQSIDGILKVSDIKNARNNNIIDIFFKSLGKVHRKLAVGIILSGTGADGSAGLRMIKKCGGHTYAQSPESATFDSMPQHAIESGVEFVLPPEQIAQHISMTIQEEFQPQHNSGQTIGPAFSNNADTDASSAHSENNHSADFYKSIVNASNNLVYVYDYDSGRVIYANDYASEHFGISTSELNDSARDILFERIHPDDQAKMSLHRDYLRNSGKAKPIEFRIMCYDGTYINTLSRDSVFKRDEKGRVLQYLGIATDITDIKKINEELSLEYSKLAHSNDELASFSSIASHDLKEPLRKIQMFAKLMVTTEKQNMSEKAQAYLDRVIVSANRMQQLIDDLISYSRNETEEIKLVKTDLNQLLQQVLEELGEMIEEHHATVNVQELPAVPVHISQFRQIFTNLIGNAIKYSKEAPIVNISARKATADEMMEFGESGERTFYRIDVADNGIGFSNEYAQKIFEPFKRLHGKDDYSGTGIGLSICKKIMSNHKGYIVASSKPGEGSVFSIYIKAGK